MLNESTGLVKIQKLLTLYHCHVELSERINNG